MLSQDKDKTQNSNNFDANVLFKYNPYRMQNAHVNQSQFGTNLRLTLISTDNNYVNLILLIEDKELRLIKPLEGHQRKVMFH